MSQLIDVRVLPHPARRASILPAFDALPTGNSLVLVSDDYPLAVLRGLLGECPNRFEWTVLASAPRFRIQISKRHTDAPREVLEYLTHDHRRLDALLDETVDFFEAGSLEAAQSVFDELVCGLDRHIRAEEDVLFPLFETNAAHTGPTAVMRDEHVQIRAAMRAIEIALAHGTERGFCDAVDLFESTMRDHNVKEEQILYPMADMMLLDDERGELVRRMQCMP
jgi:uncharacterized protein (DUF2249 family)